MASSICKDLQGSSHSLLKVTVGTGVYMMLSILEDNARTNPKLALRILTYLKEQLDNVKPCELQTSAKLPIPNIAESSFDSVHATLYSIANNDNVDLTIRTMSLELLLMLSVTRGTLSTLLSVLYMLLFRVELYMYFSANQLFSMRPSLVRLRKMHREVQLELPSQRNLMLRVNATVAIGNSRKLSMGTDDNYLYFHSEKGITKIGTGLNNTNPGFVSGQIREYRANEKSSICVIGNKIYYRSTNIAPASLIVLSTETLTEIGHVLRNGEGTYPTANNSHVCFGHSEMEEKTEVVDESTNKVDDEKNEKDSKEAEENGTGFEHIRRRMRRIMDQIVACEEDGADDDEITPLEEEYDRLMEMLPPEIQDEIVEENERGDTDEQSPEEKKEVPKGPEAIPPFSPIFTDGRFLFAVEVNKLEPDQGEDEKKGGEEEEEEEEEDEKEKENDDNEDDEAKDANESWHDMAIDFEDDETSILPSLDDINRNESKDAENLNAKTKEETILKTHLTIHAFDPEEKLEHCHSITLKRPPPKIEECVLDFNLPGYDNMSKLVSSIFVTRGHCGKKKKNANAGDQYSRTKKVQNPRKIRRA
ncbi:hypothetical protein RFI_10921 [Reticulomyxa filosa]|uniref:Uncharacterized protein n=1 Tax=Reticulomyxa filosa TaxID=46433 RepID=X6NKF2_RETFI|nr:hypothetical protein RFI_10921 [Reticulomyxa filosa]|eukprot:ETO26219.1 hypothetical protein RFI_10921 [Reticulomyxa filosa]